MITDNEFSCVVRCAPLPSIDLIIRDADRRVLVGFRNNEPAKNRSFVPGGVIRKNDTIELAFARILRAETKSAGTKRGGSDVNRSHFLYRIDMWTIDGKHVIEHLAGVEDAKLAMATYQTACERWPGTVITLRQGAKVIEDNRQVQTA